MSLNTTLSIFCEGKIRKNICTVGDWTLPDLGLGALLEVGNDVLVGSSEPEGADRLGETGLPPGGWGGHTGGGGLILPGDVSHLLGQVVSVGQPVAPVDVVGCKGRISLILTLAWLRMFYQSLQVQKPAAGVVGNSPAGLQ